MHIVNKICTLADGSDIKLEKIVLLPVKISNVTYTVRLYILPVKHLNMIIGCDLLTRLAATIDYKHNVLVIENCGEHDILPSTSENMLSQRQFSDQIGKIVERPILYGGTNLKNNETKYGS